MFWRSRTHFGRYRGHQVPFSCFAPKTTASGLVFIFCALGPIFDSTDVVGSRFYVLRSRILFRYYRARPVPFSCFALLDPFLAVPTASGPVFMFCAPVFIFDGTEGVVSRFHVLRSRTRFRRFRGHRVKFSCFALPDPFSAVPRRRVPFSCFVFPDSFSAVPRASCPVFMFCAPGPVFGGTECVASRFHVLRTRARFCRYRRHQAPLSCFAVRDPFSVVPSASGLVFMFCPPEPVFNGNEGVRSRFLVLRSLARFLRYRRRRVPFSCFPLPDSFLAIQTASVPVFMFCAPGSILAVPTASSPVFMFCAPGPVFKST
jgi:hypothetical protein